MLTAYFDESGTHGNSKIVSISGVLGNMVEWGRLEKPWAENLAVPGVSWFHAAECEERKGEFANLERPIREALFRGLATAIAEREFFVIGCSLIREDWDKCTPQSFKDSYLSPYHFCFEFVMQHIEKWSQKHADGSPISLVFAKHQEYQEDATEVHQLYQRADYKSIGSITWGDPRNVIQLQAADLVAFEIYQNIRKNMNKDEENYELRPAIEIILSNSPFVNEWYTCEAFKGLAKELGFH